MKENERIDDEGLLKDKDYYKFRRNPKTNPVRDFSDLKDKLYTVRQVTEGLGVSKWTFYNWIHQKGLASNQDTPGGNRTVRFSKLFVWLHQTRLQGSRNPVYLSRLGAMEPELFTLYSAKWHHDHHILIGELFPSLPDTLTAKQASLLTGSHEETLRSLFKRESSHYREFSVIPREEFIALMDAEPKYIKLDTATIRNPRTVAFESLPSSTQEEILMAREELYDLSRQLISQDNAYKALHDYVEKLKKQLDNMKTNIRPSLANKQRKILQKYAILEQMGIVIYDGPLVEDKNFREKFDAHEEKLMREKRKQREEKLNDSTD